MTLLLLRVGDNTTCHVRSKACKFERIVLESWMLKWIGKRESDNSVR